MLFDIFGNPLPPKKARGTKRVSNESSEVSRAKKALLARAKRTERNFARWAIKHNGRDVRFASLTTSTGRIGHVTNIQADILSRSLLGESKHMILPVGLAKMWQTTLERGDAVGTDKELSVVVARFWQKICVKSEEWSKEPVLFWKPSNADKFMVNGKPLPDLHVIREERHRELLLKAHYAETHGYYDQDE